MIQRSHKEPKLVLSVILAGMNSTQFEVSRGMLAVFMKLYVIKSNAMCEVTHSNKNKTNLD